jgi:hypothetical protein
VTASSVWSSRVVVVVDALAGALEQQARGGGKEGEDAVTARTRGANQYRVGQ